MRDFDYGNARLRAMKSRLLTQRDLESLTEVGSLKGLIVALTKTPYRKTVEAALSRSSGMSCISNALRDDLINTLGSIRDFYEDEAQKMVVIVLRRYDLHNLKTILRGLSQHAAPSEIHSTLIPVGELNQPLLEELTSAPDPRSAIDLLASINSTVAGPLLQLRAEHPGADVTRMELALEQWSLTHSKSCLESELQNGKVLSAAIDLDADLSNLLTALRFAQTPEERKLLQEWIGEDDLLPLLLGPGSLPFDLLVQAGMQDTLVAAVEIFAGTNYSNALKAGLDAYAHSNRLSDLERQLRVYRLRWMSEKIISDPLGIGVVLGYTALKISEVGNLRWVAHGVNLGMSAQLIRTSLEFV
ncbi:MAG: V-type ATPase subunit [Anaerolineales bacterium]